MEIEAVSSEYWYSQTLPILYYVINILFNNEILCPFFSPI